MTIAKSVRRPVLAKYGVKCVRCGRDLPVVLHHIDPESNGGKATVDNLIPLCSNKTGKGSCHVAIHGYLITYLQDCKIREREPDFERAFAKWLAQWES